MRRQLISCFALLLCSAPAFAQSNNAPDLRITTTIVAVPAVVRDKHGALENNLHRDDFALRVDGKPQALRYFDHDNDLPLTLGLLIDTSLSQRTVLDKEKTASAAFLEKMLTPIDKAFVMQFDIHTDLLQDVTNSRPLLEKSLQNVDIPHPDFTGITPPGPGATQEEREAYQKARRAAVHKITGTKLFDAVYLASNEITAKQPGRRALILLTDGGDYGSVQSIDEAIEAAQRADTIVYGIYYVAPFGAFRHGLLSPNQGISSPPANTPATGPAPGQQFVSSDAAATSFAGAGPLRHLLHHNDGKHILEAICNDTGGRVFVVSDKLSVDEIYAQIAEELRAQYRLGFTPGEAPGYHQIQLSLTGPAAKGKHTIQTRDGFYVGPPTPDTTPAPVK